MLKKFGFIVLLFIATLSTQAVATINHSLQAGITLEYDLPSNDPQVFTNYMFWAIETNCKIHSEDSSNVLFIKAIAKKGKVNDLPLSKGESMNITVHDNDVLKLSADSGAKVEITNVGEHTIKAICTS